MNYGEEIASWYLRLNGFFLVTNFVIHSSRKVKDSADADLLGMRPPHVYEEIGGQDDDWDQQIARAFGFQRTVGLICEVKTGGFKEEKLFRPQYVESCVGRLGLVPKDQIKQVADSLDRLPLVETEEGCVIGKLFITNAVHRGDRYVTITLDAAEDFLRKRVEKYPKQKYRDRMFFPSDLIQFVIHRVSRERKEREFPASK